MALILDPGTWAAIVSVTPVSPLSETLEDSDSV